LAAIIGQECDEPTRELYPMEATRLGIRLNAFMHEVFEESIRVRQQEFYARAAIRSANHTKENSDE
jgi:hypothetical protein